MQGGVQRRSDRTSSSFPLRDPLSDFYRCPDELVVFTPPAALFPKPGYFQFGPGTICYGQSIIPTPTTITAGPLPDLLERVEMEGESLRLPFHPHAILNNLRMERYPVETGAKLTTLLSSEAVRSVYYALRPSLPDGLRKILQRIYLKDFRNLAFPKWPLDTTVEQIQERLLLLFMRSRNLSTIPFIWFWPNGATASAIVTHDVETTAGLNFVEPLMKLDSNFGIQSSFQIVPEKRYQVSDATLEAIRAQHCEVNVQGLDHDGNIFKDRDTFRKASKQINEYVRAFRADGFRSPSMYRNADWLEEINVSYDMSIPNAAHLEPQRGGCGTVFPYFIGSLLELPLTMIQDYSLFRVLGDYSLRSWETQMDSVIALHGLNSFIVHPDYLLEAKARAVYEELLSHLSDLRSKTNLWIALPGEVNRWWRQRHAMKLAFLEGQWQVLGEGRERARVAFAHIRNGGIAYTVAPTYQASNV